jgi:glutathione synthase/RimK-type ligase-like ATP-grasp enzyme
MRPDVLILSSIYDFASDLVALELKDRGIPFLRLNREQLDEYEIALDPAGPTLSARHGVNRWQVSPDLKSVWFRQPVFLRNTPAEPLSPEGQLKLSQWMAFLRGLSVFQNAHWMNAPQATYLAESKPYQLLLARQLGFNVPRTLVGNDALAIADEFELPFVVKSLDTVLVRDGDDTLFTYTTIQRSHLESNSIRSAPVIAQTLIEPKTDIRVTVVGDTVFAACILGNGRPVSGDWRVLPKDDLSYPDYELDRDTNRRCVDLVVKLGLSFGAIDLVDSEVGTQFIEINPTGEWAWLANADRPVENAIVDWLTR